MARAVDEVQAGLEKALEARTDELQQQAHFASIGRASSNVSHELRNPLGVMNNVVFMLDALPESSPKIKEYARVLREQIRLSRRLIDDLLDQARIRLWRCGTWS
jgi:signal transduction histidine kinase